MAAKKLSPGTQNTVFTLWASKASINKLAPVGWVVVVMVVGALQKIVTQKTAIDAGLYPRFEYALCGALAP
jgi:hypothetical protein